MDKSQVKHIFETNGIILEMQGPRTVYAGPNRSIDCYPENPIQPILFDIMLIVDEAEEDFIEIGTLWLGNFNSQAAEKEGISFRDLLVIADEEGAAWGEAFSSLENAVKARKKELGKTKYMPEICYIDNISIKSEYRGVGIGSYIMKNLHEIVTSSMYFSTSPDFYATTAYPELTDQEERDSTSDQIKDRTDDVVRFLKKAGFKKAKSELAIYYKEV